MLTPEELKIRLLNLPDGQVELELLEPMTVYLGSLDSQLRDDLIYTKFADWITSGNLDPAHLHDLVATSLDANHLFYQIGSSGTGAVFMRSFSVLLLALLVYRHRQSPYLELANLLQIKNAIIEYSGQETDRRGYVPGPGWAHSAAHTADLLDELAQCPELGLPDCLDLLGAIGQLATNPYCGYAHNEDDRMSIAAISIFKRSLLNLDDWSRWLDNLASPDIFSQPFPNGYYARTNVRLFLNSFSYRLRFLPGTINQRTPLLTEIDATLSKVIRL